VVGWMNEVQKLEWNFSELVENSGDIFIALDDQFKIRYTSSSILRMYGIEPINLIGRSIFDFIGPELIDVYKQGLLNSPVDESNEIALELQKGVRTYFEVYISPTMKQDASQKGFALKLHDVTLKKLKEKELINTNKQLDQVIYKTTHDLKAPLMSAIGLVNLAEKAPADQQQEYLAMIKRSLFKLSSFIEEMNNFFRNEKLALQRERIDIKELIEDEIDNLKNLYQAGRIKIEIVTEGSSEFFSDNVRLKTIIGNILTNAIKYADPEKEVPFIKVQARVQADFCTIAVEDNGIGIEEEFKSKIFDLFYRATSQSQGTGIGLFIVKDTVERLNGKIEVQSQIGQGTIFKVQIPNQLFKTAELN
jgi:PAS domain S-box-containing protein